MVSPRVVELMIQSIDVAPRVPQHRPSGWLLLPWPYLVVMTDTADNSTPLNNEMLEAAVHNIVDVVGELPHWWLITAWLRSVRAPPLRSSAMVPLSRAVASGTMGFEVVWSFFTVPAAVLLGGQMAPS